MTPEGAVKATIKKYLKTLASCWFFMPVPYGYGVGGVPDIVGCYRGRFFAIEVKAPGKAGTTTPLQKATIAAINGAAGYVTVAVSVVEVMDLIAWIDTDVEGKKDG